METHGDKINRIPQVVKELLDRPIPDSGDKREAARKLILETSFRKFLRYGTRRVTMEEIARDLRISKRRIYEFFESKEALVKACLDHLAMMTLPKMLNALNSSDGVSERFLSMQRVIFDVSSMLTSEFITDIKLEFPHLWEIVNERRMFVVSNLENLIEEGMKNGEIWPDIHPKAVMSIIMNTVLNVISPEAFSTGQFTPQQAIHSMLAMIGRGLFIKPLSFEAFFNSQSPQVVNSGER